MIKRLKLNVAIKDLIKLAKLGLVSAALNLAAPALAICPLCIAAAGVGAGLSEYLHIDDLIVGLWLGALFYGVVSVSTQRLNGRFTINISITAVLITLSAATLDRFKLTGGRLNQLFGLNRLVIGMIIGSLWLLISETSYNFLKARHQNRAWFPFQKVVMALLPLIAMSIICL